MSVILHQALLSSYQAVGGGGGNDPNFANVTLLLKMDGTNGGTTFIDSSLASRTPSNVTAVTTTNVQARFGDTSAVASSALGAQLTYASNAAFAWPLNGEATLEFWIYCPSNIALTGFLLANSGARQCQVSGAANTSNATMTPSGFGSGSFSLVRDQWHHIAIVRYANNTSRGFLNGNGVGSGAMSTSSDATNPFGVFNVPGRTDIATCRDVYIDELRWTQNVARYSANFTPPSEPFPTS